MTSNLREFEERALACGYSLVAGIDEAGRGPLAGPVVSAAVIFPHEFQSDEITDSKKLTPKKRSALYGLICEKAISVGIGIVDSEEIDRINILQASLVSMAISVENLIPAPQYLLIDGTFQIKSHLPQEAIPKGDAKSISIAAASIVAKVTRDRIMKKYDEQYPMYGFGKHKGYPTKAHREAIREFGCTPIHRRTFRGVREIC